jgi:hypothetical protein
MLIIKQPEIKMNQTPTRILYIVICSISVLALIGVSALSASLFVKNYADPAILTALISITSGLVGSLGTILANTRQTSGAATMTTTVTTPPISGNGGTTVPVKVENTPAEPVPTAPQPPKP